MIPDPDMAQFRSEIDRTMKAVEAEVLELTSVVTAEVMRDLIERSPVLTGAYRASHAVVLGAGAGSIVYEGPARPGGDEIVPRGVAVLAPPDPDAAGDAVRRQAEPGERLEIWNGRFYASYLEYGTATMEPRSIYASAVEVGNAIVAGLANRKTVIVG